MDKKIPQRKCVGCREAHDKKDLIRIVRSKEGVISLDESGKANGRGAYVCKKKACLERAVKTKGLDRAFKERVSSDVYEGLKKEFERFE